MQKTDSVTGSENTKRESVSIDAIRMSLKNMRPNLSSQSQQKLPMSEITRSLKLRPKSLIDIPESIDKNRKSAVSEETKTEFVRSYSYGDLGEKLKKLRPVNKNKNNNKFLLTELNERLQKLREMEEEMESSSGWKFGHLRESLAKLQEDDRTKKNLGTFLLSFGQF